MYVLSKFKCALHEENVVSLLRNIEITFIGNSFLPLEDTEDRSR